MTTPTADPLVARLEVLEAKLDAATRRARSRSWIAPTLAVISTCLIAYWLYYAHHRFSTEVNPDLIAQLSQSYLQDNLPQAGQQLEASLRENAPSFINEGEARLKALPERLTTQLRTAAIQKIEQQMPEVQTRLAAALKQGLDEAKGAGAGGVATDNDDVRFHAMVNELGKVYRAETLKFVDQVHQQYTEASGNIVANLAVLAEGKGLTPTQESQRRLVHDFLVLAREYDAHSSKDKEQSPAPPAP